MKCSNCGKKLNGNENFCRICGTPVVKEEVVEEEKKEEKLELTDNIDVSKININVDSSVVNDDTMDVELPDKEKNKEISAMIEITKNPEDEQVLDIEEKNKKKSKKKKEEKTEERKFDSSNKIKEILEEMKPEVEGEIAKNNVNEMIDEMKEPTAIIPDNLINDYKKDIDGEKEETKTVPIEVSVEDSEDNIDNNDKETDNSSDSEKKDETVEEEQQVKKEETMELIETSDEVKTENEEDEENSEDLDEIEKESIISLEDDETQTLDLVEEKEETEKFDEPLITKEETDEEFYEEGKSHKAVVFAILFILALACAGYLFFMYITSHKQMNDYKEKYEKLNNTQEKVEPSKDKPEESKIQIKNNIEYNGYIFNIAEGTTYNITQNNLVFNNEDYQVALSIKSDTKYTTIKYAKEDYKKNLESNDYEVQSYGTKVTDEVEYVVYELKDKNSNMYLVAYTKLNENDTIAFILSNKSNKIDYDLLKETNNIIKNSKENSNSNNYNINLFKNIE